MAGSRLKTRKQLGQLGFVGAPDSVDGLGKTIDFYLKRYGDLIRNTGISIK